MLNNSGHSIKFYIKYIIMKDISMELQSGADYGKQYYNQFQNGRVVSITNKNYKTITSSLKFDIISLFLCLV